MSGSCGIGIGLLSMTILMSLSGCGPTGIPVSPDLGAGNLPHATELVTAAVTPPGLTRIGLRVTAGCGVGGDGQLFAEDAPRRYGCTVSAAAAQALSGITSARPALGAVEAAMVAAGCQSRGPASTTLSGQDVSTLDTDADSSYVTEEFVCGDQQVTVFFGRADSQILQEDTDGLSARGGGTPVRDDSPLELAALTSALEAQEHVTVDFLAVIYTGVSYLDIYECGMRACDTHGNPVIPDTSFPTPQP